jgi:hypothetical protein
MDYRGGGLLLGARDQKGHTCNSNHGPLHQVSREHVKDKLRLISG